MAIYGLLRAWMAGQLMGIGYDRRTGSCEYRNSIHIPCGRGNNMKFRALRFLRVWLKHLYAQRRACGDLCHPSVSTENRQLRRAANQGIRFICNFMSRLTVTSRFVTRERAMECLKPRLHCMCLRFQRFA